MREILFRGKHIHALPQNEHLDGTWVYGYLCDENYINTVDEDEYGGKFTSEMLIDPETVCQYTGLNDNTRWEELSESEKEKFLCEWKSEKNDRKNTRYDWMGRKIFEGDIVKAILLPYNKDGYSVGYIVFERGTFKVYITKSVHKGEYTKYAKEDAKTYSIENNFLNRGYVLEVIGNIFDNPELLEVENEID